MYVFCVSENVCVSHHVSGVCFHTRKQGKPPPLLVFHSTAFVIGQSQKFFNTTQPPFVLTWHDDPADKRKQREERHLASGQPHCFFKTCHGLNDGTKSCSVYFQIHLMWKNSRKCPRRVCVGLIKDILFCVYSSSETLRQWPYSTLLVPQFTSKKAQ